MDMRQASELREQWGSKPCKHPNLEKEDRIFGQWSGDWVCTQCGATGPREHFEKPSKPAD